MIDSCAEVVNVHIVTDTPEINIFLFIAICKNLLLEEKERKYFSSIYILTKTQECHLFF